VIVTNLIGAITGDLSRLLRSMTRTYRTVFPTVELHPVFLEGDRDPSTLRNVILVATESAAPSRDFLAERWRAVRARVAPSAPDLTAPIRDRWEADVALGDVPLLTDDYAPTDALLLLFG
jgi:hypothetical protein